MSAKSAKSANTSNLKSLDNNTLIHRLEELIRLEKRTMAEVLDYIKEVDRRRLYLSLGHTSLFAYLTKGLGYTPASAQRRIDSARIMQSLPEIKNDLKSGALNLMQVSMVAQSIRQKQKEKPQAHFNQQDKKQLLERVKNQDVLATQKILSKSLDLEIKIHEKQTYQKDESVRMEITFTKAEMDLLVRAKELLSHTNPNSTWAELIGQIVQDFVKRKDPLIKKPKKSTSKMEAAALTKKTVKRAIPSGSMTKISGNMRASERKAIPINLKRYVFQRDRCCQWKLGTTGRICGSHFQLQLDHKQPVWAGGDNEARNLQLLCSVHNQLKYKMESGRALMLK